MEPSAFTWAPSVLLVPLITTTPQPPVPHSAAAVKSGIAGDGNKRST